MKQGTAEYNAYMADYMTRRYHKRRFQAIEYLGGACNHCHATTNLEIDHVDPTSKSFDLGKALSGWAWERILVELDKCRECLDARARYMVEYRKRKKDPHGRKVPAMPILPRVS